MRYSIGPMDLGDREAERLAGEMQRVVSGHPFRGPIKIGPVLEVADGRCGASVDLQRYVQANAWGSGEPPSRLFGVTAQPPGVLLDLGLCSYPEQARLPGWRWTGRLEVVTPDRTRARRYRRAAEAYAADLFRELRDRGILDIRVDG